MSADPRVLPPRPTSPGYWILRGFWLTVFVLGGFGEVAFLFYGLQDLHAFEFQFQIALMILGAVCVWLAGSFFFLFNAAAQLDRLVTARLWEAGRLPGALPRQRYNWPLMALMAAGGVYPLILIRLSVYLSEGEYQEALTPILVSGVIVTLIIFICAFMLEELRAFFLRMENFSKELNNAVTQPPTSRRYSIGLMLGMSGLCAIAMGQLWLAHNTYIEDDYSYFYSGNQFNSGLYLYWFCFAVAATPALLLTVYALARFLRAVPDPTISYYAAPRGWRFEVCTYGPWMTCGTVGLGGSLMLIENPSYFRYEIWLIVLPIASAIFFFYLWREYEAWQTAWAQRWAVFPKAQYGSEENEEPGRNWPRWWVTYFGGWMIVFSLGWTAFVWVWEFTRHSNFELKNLLLVTGILIIGQHVGYLILSRCIAIMLEARDKLKNPNA